MARDFWKSAGMHLLAPGAEGWLAVTPDFVRAYLTRPEIHPVEDSCASEIALHEELMEQPALPVSDQRLAVLRDPDAVENYRAFLSFRDHLLAAGTIEGAYLRLARASDQHVPPVFLDQLVHLILRNVLKDVRDPIRVRAAELFFREQTVSTEDGRILLADREIVDMKVRSAADTGLAQLLAQTGTPMRSVSLDVLGEDNGDIYWPRSDRFDTVIDLRFEQPALDALARVIESWLAHLLRIDTKVEPRPKLEDADWRWHIGLDRESNAILNALYRGEPVAADDIARLVALFRLRLADDDLVIDRVRGKPIYMALAMTQDRKLRMKPQNLLVNLPLRIGN